METVKLVFDAAWQILLAGLVLGAGLPVLFALGVRAGAGAEPEIGADGVAIATAPGPLSRALSVACFAAVLFGVVVGILVIVGAGMGMVVSFEHIFPTLVPKG